MVNKHITLADPVAEVIQSQISTGRYKDISAALNDAAWHHFIGSTSPFEEYGVTPDEVERCAQNVMKQIRAQDKSGNLPELAGL